MVAVVAARVMACRSLLRALSGFAADAMFEMLMAEEAANDNKKGKKLKAKKNKKKKKK